MKKKIAEITTLPQILIAEIEDFKEDCVKILRPYRLEFPKNMLKKYISQFIVLNDSANPKMIMKKYFNFSDFS